MAKRGRPRHPDVLTPREWEVLSLLRENLTNEQIAERLGVTLHAARYHVSQILSKLGVATREEAAVWQPEPVRAGPHWSIAFQIWLTAAAAVAVIAVGVLAWGVARGSGDDEPAASPTPSQPTVTQPVASATDSPVSTFAHPTPPITGPSVFEMQLLDEGFAVMLTAQGLYTTALVPQGERIDVPEVDITPSGITNMGGFWFLDREHGWVVSTGRRNEAYETQVFVYRTSDGGQTWSSAPMGELNQNVGDRPLVSIDFINSNRGWILEREPTSTQSSYGVLYRTDDGGATWTKLSAPSGESIHFTDENTGWQTSGGGLYGNRTLYVTRDGGESWNDASDITPLAEPAGPRAFGLPMAVDGGSRLLLPVTMAIENHPSLFIVYSSTDGGDSWRQLALTTIGEGVNVGVPLLSHIFPNGRVVAIKQNSSTGVILPSGSSELVQFSVVGLTGAMDVQFADDEHGWALIYGCVASGDQCLERLWPNYIEQTDDGGITWSPR
jgi:DNA-binding CsgD family transcriptional regulator/photosystem II stability/assembly factor-like uncharacterized protein